MVAQMVKNLPAMQETQLLSLGGEDPLEKGIINPLWYSCLENPMNREAWQATVHGVANSWTQLNDPRTQYLYVQYLKIVMNMLLKMSH